MQIPKSTPGQTINELAPGVFKTLIKIRPSGALQARRQSSGTVTFFWRYSIGNKSERVHIGLYDSSAVPKSLAPTGKGYSFAAAVRAAETLALQHHEYKGEGGRPALLAVQREAARQAEAAKEAAAKNTLRNLLDDYCDYLEGLGRVAHAETRSIFKLHVFEPWPNISRLPAAEVTGENISDMMRRVTELGKGRTSNKLRSYIRAAYQTAKASRSKASIPKGFKVFAITHNPAIDTEPDDNQNRTDKNPLESGDLRAYWKLLQNVPGFKGAALRFHLLTGAQRIAQLVRLKTADIADDIILLHDGKGRPGKAPRMHHVPLTAAAGIALLECNPSGLYALSTDGGKTKLASTTLSNWAVEVASGIEKFQTKRLRSGVETMLAKAGISLELRGRLQSHGIAGVQARHYDGYDYYAEKLHALDTLYERLSEAERTTRPHTQNELRASATKKHKTSH